VKKYKDRETLRKICKDTVRKNIVDAGICCFTRNENNFLMWSHYTNKHSGLLLKLKTTSSGINFMDVAYTEKFKPTSFIKSPLVSLMCMAFTKSKYWEYEEELRTIMPVINDDSE
jgi:hypothetical protein